ncbi:hypothetical protein FRC03_008726 [Tulasnella sp. 419]|nr:hypothetical protein FRC03_008726 [Tulasnella sp. 419]
MINTLHTPQFARNMKYAELIEALWNSSKVMIPVETSDPHPFISLLVPLKGKRLLPRLIRHLPENKISLLTALFVACFYQLDVVRDAPILDDVLGQGATPRWKEVSLNTDAFLTTVLPAITAVLAGTSLRLLTGFLNIMLGTGKDAILQIAKSQPGVALLTAFMGRADQLKHESNELDGTTPDDWNKWQAAFDSLLNFLQGSIVSLFPSRRVLSNLPQAPLNAIPLDLDLADQIVWQLLAVLAASKRS